MRNLLKQLAGKARAFVRSKRGNVAMMFGLAMVPIVIAAGVGLDYARAMLVHQQMAEALDAAALAVGSTTGLNATTAQQLAQKYFDANYTVDKTAFGTPTIPPLTYDANGSVALTANDNMDTILMKVVGITTIPITTTSTVVWGQTKLWVALVLDNSGSMCEPDSQPCLNDSNTASKIYQLKNATTTMLTSLQGVSTTPGDVKVAIVPFNREVDVGTGYSAASWLYWGFWEAVPQASGTTTITDIYGVTNQNGSTSSSPSTIAFAAWGPGDNCPFTVYNSNNSTSSTNTLMLPFGFYCMPTSVNTVVSFNSDDNATTTNRVPSSGTYNGQLCPSMDNGAYNTERNAHYYNGCWTSTKVTTGTTTVTVDQGSSSASCKGFAAANCSCSGSNGSKICKTQKWLHTWVPNAHSTWGGCVTDRAQDYDISKTTPVSTDTTGFPADNPANPVSSTNCMYGNVTALENNWSDLTAQANAMQAKGSTNQAIGVAHGWMTMTNSAPYNPGAVPANTTRYIILLSDGLNTQDRWWGNGSTEGTSDDAKIDDRMNKVCAAAKADGVVVYSLYVHVNGGGNSTPLQNCATDASKYYDLTSSSQIAAAFADITKQITNVRVSK